MPYCQLYYHLVWRTKNRRPLLTADVEPIIYDFLVTKVIRLGGFLYALNGLEDHVHMAVYIPSKLAVSSFIGQIKGAASAQFNKEYKQYPPFFWQEDYAAFSFDKKRLPYLVDYVENQKAYHREGKLIPILEKIDGDFNPLLRETAVSYLSHKDQWWQEMLQSSA